VPELAMPKPCSQALPAVLQSNLIRRLQCCEADGAITSSGQYIGKTLQKWRMTRDMRKARRDLVDMVSEGNPQNPQNR
jgi:hypothetical protein